MGFDWYGSVFAFDPGKTCLLEIWDLSEGEVDLNEGRVRKWYVLRKTEKNYQGGNMRPQNTGKKEQLLLSLNVL